MKTLPVAVLVAAACLSMSGCKRESRDHDAPPKGAEAAPRATSAQASGHAVLRAGDTVAGAPAYDLETTLTDQDGARAPFAVFRGHPVIISMFYSSCPSACPTLITNVKRIEAALDPAARADLRVLLVSFDPAHDAPEALRAVVARHKLDTSRWKLATTTESEVREIAAVLGITYRQADGSFNHSSIITVLDREGHIDLRSDGLADDAPQVTARLEELHAKSR